MSEAVWTPVISSARYDANRNAVEASLTLAPVAPAGLGIYDVSGRRVAGSDVAASAGPTRSLQFPLPSSTRSAVYFLRLTQLDRVATARIVVLR